MGLTACREFSLEDAKAEFDPVYAAGARGLVRSCGVVPTQNRRGCDRVISSRMRMSASWGFELGADICGPGSGWTDVLPPPSHPTRPHTPGHGPRRVEPNQPQG